MNNKIFNIPNMLSFSRIIFGIIFIILFFIMKNNELSRGYLLALEIISTLIFIAAIVSDALDGYFARKENDVTDFGKHLDPLTDSIFFLIVFFSFFYLGLMRWFFLVIVAVRELFMHIFLRPYFKKKGSSLPANIYGKLKTVLQSVFSLTLLSAMMFRNILLFFLESSSLFYPKYDFYFRLSADLFFGIIAFASLFSMAVYLKNFADLFKKKI